MKTYRLEESKLVPDEKGIWTLRCNVDVLQGELNAARREIRELRESELKLATALRDLQDATIDETLKRLPK